MKSFRQDRDHDIVVQDGQFVLASGKETHGNILEDAVRTLTGELQLDEDRGIPYRTTVWRSSAFLQVWKNYVSDTVSSFPFVRSINLFDAEIKEDGTLRYRLDVSTDEGAVVISSP